MLRLDNVSIPTKFVRTVTVTIYNTEQMSLRKTGMGLKGILIETKIEHPSVQLDPGMVTW